MKIITYECKGCLGNMELFYDPENKYDYAKCEDCGKRINKIKIIVERI